MNNRQTTLSLLLIALASILLPEVSISQRHAATDMFTNGDVNGDGVFDLFDIMRLERTVSLGMGAQDEELSAGDVDGNRRLDKFDLLVMKEALELVKDGVPMFDAVKEAIESDLGKTSDNVETYLDLSRFYCKEQMYQRSRSVLESILEALDTDHPLYNQAVNQLNEAKQGQAREIEAAEDFLNQDAYQAAGDLAGKTSLRRSVVQLKSKLSKLMDDQKFGAHYNSKRVKSQLGNLMDDMLRTIGKDQMVDAGAFDQFNSDVRGILENPENLVKQLGSQQRSLIKDIVDTSTGSMRREAVKIRQDYARGSSTARSTGAGTQPGETLLNRNEWRLENNIRGENMEAQGRVSANSPLLEPDTISIITPQYKLSWDVSNILGAKNSALEISKANTKFSNPRGNSPDQEATLFYTPSLGTVKGELRNSALGLEGVGTYYYRVAALNNKGELISPFSDATPLVVVYNNLDVAASSPKIEPRVASTGKPDYSFRWDVSNIEGARDAAVEISKPGASFGNPNGRARDRINTFFFNPSLGRISGSFTSSINGLTGPGVYLFRVIAVSPNEDFMGQWSDTDTLIITSEEDSGAPTTPPSQDNQPVAPMDIPPPPDVLSSDDGFSISWDVNEIGSAKGVNFELARLIGGSSPASNEVDEVIISQPMDSTTGKIEVDSGLLDKPGRYQARVAAVDSAGNLLSGWSEPAMLDIKYQDKSQEPSQPDVQTAQGQSVQSNSTSQAAGGPRQQDSTAAVKEGPAQVSLSGNTVVVNSDNTILFENNNPSSSELASLEEGDKLIHVSTAGLWYKVYYPKGGKEGWVLSWSVSPQSQ